MSVEGEGDFKKYRKQAGFWLEVEEVCKEALPARSKLKELEAIVSFIPKFIMDRAREAFRRLGRAKMFENETVSTFESIIHTKTR